MSLLVTLLLPITLSLVITLDGSADSLGRVLPGLLLVTRSEVLVVGLLLALVLLLVTAWDLLTSEAEEDDVFLSVKSKHVHNLTRFTNCKKDIDFLITLTPRQTSVYFSPNSLT